MKTVFCLLKASKNNVRRDQFRRQAPVQDKRAPLGKEAYPSPQFSTIEIAYL